MFVPKALLERGSCIWRLSPDGMVESSKSLEQVVEFRFLPLRAVVHDQMLKPVCCEEGRQDSIKLGELLPRRSTSSSESSGTPDTWQFVMTIVTRR